MVFPFIESYSWKGLQGHLVVLTDIIHEEMEAPRGDVSDPLSQGQVSMESEVVYISLSESTSVSVLPIPDPPNQLSRPACVLTLKALQTQAHPKGFVSAEYSCLVSACICFFSGEVFEML